MDSNLVEMRMRAMQIMNFAHDASYNGWDAAEADKQMNRLRAHCKALNFAARRFLKENQPEWYKLSQEDRSKAIVQSFSNEEDRASAQRYEDEERQRRAAKLKATFSPKGVVNER